MAIDLVGLSRPVDYQISSGRSLRVFLFSGAEELDFHVAQVACPAGLTVSASAGWVHRHRVAVTDQIAQELWTYTVGATPPESVLFSFSAIQGEKWVGVHTFRGVDTTDPIADVDGRTTDSMTYQE